jgi:hypothetical protein
MPPPSTTQRLLLVYRSHSSTLAYYPAMLAQAGFAVDVLTTPGHPVRRSRYVQNTFGATSDDEFQVKLERLTDKEDYKVLILMDEEARTLSYQMTPCAHRDQLLPIPRQNALIGAVRDKILFHTWCESHGLPVLRTRFLDSEEHAVTEASLMGYPVVLKCSIGGGGKAVLICRDEQMMRNYYTEMQILGRMLIQEFVTGPVGSVSFAARRGRVGAWIAGEKFIALRAGLGPSVVRLTRDDAALGQLARQVAVAGELTGITGFDWMEVEPGRFVIIDPHCGRATPPAVIGRYCGVDLGQALGRLFADDYRLDHPTTAGDRVAMFPQIIELAFEGRCGELFRLARPWGARVHYFWGPRAEWRMTLYMGLQYIYAGCRIWGGRMRKNLKMKIGRYP